jgi:hypothetical protein
MIKILDNRTVNQSNQRGSLMKVFQSTPSKLVERLVLFVTLTGLTAFEIHTAGAAPPIPYTLHSSNSSDINAPPLKEGDWIWFNANFQVSGIPSQGATIYLTKSSISFTVDGSYNLPASDATITFSPNAKCTSTKFDTATNTWQTTAPVKGDDEVFLSGRSFRVPPNFANVAGKLKGPVVWQGTFGSDVPGVTIQWKWGAAFYKLFFGLDGYNTLDIKPSHQNSCNTGKDDHAGTPENQAIKDTVISSGRSSGGSDWTGSWSGTIAVSPQRN